MGIAEDAAEQIRSETRAAETERRNAVDSLTAGLARNLNNILMVVLGNVDQMVAELADDHLVRRNAGMTRQAGLRAAAITRRLMVIAIADNGAGKDDDTRRGPCEIHGSFLHPAPTLIVTDTDRGPRGGCTRFACHDRELPHEVPGRQRVTSWPRSARDDRGVEIANPAIATNV